LGRPGCCDRNPGSHCLSLGKAVQPELKTLLKIHFRMGARFVESSRALVRCGHLRELVFQVYYQPFSLRENWFWKSTGSPVP
jgi:hypothetical protein